MSNNQKNISDFLVRGIKKLFKTFSRSKSTISKKFESHEISPEDIFIDSVNISEMDEDKFEGRLEKPISKNVARNVGLFFVMIVLISVGRLFFLQIAEGQEYREWSQDNRLKHETIFSNRGVITDRNDKSLAWNEKSATTSIPFSERRYINEPGFAHLLGHVSRPKKDNSGAYYQSSFIGKGGVEEAYDEYLKGETGVLLVEENARFEEQSRSVINPPEDGKNLRLSIDAGVQKVLFEEIRGLSQRAGFVGGAGAIVDVQTGELLALTSFPEYDSQVLTDGSDSNLIQEFLQDERSVFLNRAVSGLYTPGSTVKPFVAIGALEEGIINPQKEILSTGALVVPNPFFPDKPTIFRDWKVHGWVDMREALAVSSNEYFFHIGGGFESQRGLGIEKINEYSRAFGLGEKTGIDLDGEKEGVVPNVQWKKEVFGEGWRKGDTYNTSIGQYGFQITPIQLLRAVAAVANGGTLVVPHVVRGSSDIPEEEILVNEQNLKIVREGMRQGAISGTGSALGVPYVKVAAKTGTAELGVSKASVNSWVTGFFPYDNPKYAFVVVMESGSRENIYGAVGVMRNVLDWMNLNTPEYLE